MIHSAGRLKAVQILAVIVCLRCVDRLSADEAAIPPVAYHLATFSADVTPPIGHPLLASLGHDVVDIADPLSANGCVFLGAGKPVVLVSVDWCEIRGEAYDRWRNVLAEAAGTTPDRVMVSSVHQHDAPLADFEAERILSEHKLPGKVCDPTFHERAVQGVAAAVRKSLASARQVTHLGTGKAKVYGVASNRRYVLADGVPRFNRSSHSNINDAPEGTVDPWLRTLSFWDGDRAIAAVSVYATHPMSFYREGHVSCDFPGIVRHRRQLDDASIAQIYFSGCSGNLTAGMYNDGNPLNRPILAERLYRGMLAAWQDTERRPIGKVEFRSVPLRIEARNTGSHTVENLTKTVDSGKFNDQIKAALGLSWHKRADAGYALDMPVLDFGAAQFVLLPGETYVEYQLLAQSIRPDSFVVVAGYGECQPGYIGTAQAWQEADGNLNEHDWCWTTPAAEKAMTAALGEALKRK